MRQRDSRVRLELVPESESYHFVVAALSDESVYAEVSSYASRAADDVDAQLTAFRKGQLAGDQLHWEIRDRKTNECLGSLQANRKSDQIIEIGYRVHSEHQNIGTATEALCQLLLELRDSMGTYRFVAYPENIPSERVLLKANFMEVITQSEGMGFPETYKRCFQYLDHNEACNESGA